MTPQSPAPSTPKQERALATRATILEAAAKAFIEHGYSDATLAKIRANSGVTNGALYHHFSTREAVAMAVVDEYRRRATEIGWRVVAEASDGIDALFRLSRAFAECLQKDVLVLAGVILTTEVGSKIPAEEPYGLWIENLTHLVNRCQDEGSIRSDVRASDVSALLVSAFTGLQLLSAAVSDRRDILTRVSVSWHLLLGGFMVRDERTDERFADVFRGVATPD